jgi:hypothetical protein
MDGAGAGAGAGASSGRPVFNPYAVIENSKTGIKIEHLGKNIIRKANAITDAYQDARGSSKGISQQKKNRLQELRSSLEARVNKYGELKTALDWIGGAKGKRRDKLVFIESVAKSIMGQIDKDLAQDTKELRRVGFNEMAETLKGPELVADQTKETVTFNVKEEGKQVSGIRGTPGKAGKPRQMDETQTAEKLRGQGADLYLAIPSDTIELFADIKKEVQFQLSNAIVFDMFAHFQDFVENEMEQIRAETHPNLLDSTISRFIEEYAPLVGQEQYQADLMEAEASTSTNLSQAIAKGTKLRDDAKAALDELPLTKQRTIKSILDLKTKYDRAAFDEFGAPNSLKEGGELTKRGLAFRKYKNKMEDIYKTEPELAKKIQNYINQSEHVGSLQRTLDSTMYRSKSTTKARIHEEELQDGIAMLRQIEAGSVWKKWKQMEKIKGLERK